MKLDLSLKNFKNNTNILDLDVPAILDKRILTGLDFWDDVLGEGDAAEDQGMTPTTAYIFTGGPGAGKTTTMLQLADSITQGGNVCLYNTGEESLFQVRKVVRRLDLKHGFKAGQDTHVPTLLKHAAELQKLNKRKQLFMIIDSLQTMNDGKYGLNTNGGTPQRVTEQIVDFCKDNGAIAIIIGQVTKDENTFAGKQSVKHTVDGHAHLTVIQDKKSPFFGRRVLYTTKNRFGIAGFDRGHILDIGRSGLKSLLKVENAADMISA